MKREKIKKKKKKENHARTSVSEDQRNPGSNKPGSSNISLQ